MTSKVTSQNVTGDNVFGEILKWADELSDWQSDALRRIIQKRSLTDQDYGEILHNLKVESKIFAEPFQNLKRLTKKDLPTLENPSQLTVLQSMFDMANVNAIVPNQKLSFSEKGITIVYGANASGKSGYARVMKKACRARDDGESILPDVFKTRTGQNFPEASFSIKIGNEEVTVKWRDGSESPDALASISVFDSRCARVYVDDKNDVAYLPYGLEVFDELARVYDELKSRINSEIASINIDDSGFADLKSSTEVGKAISVLCSKTKKEELGKLATLTPADLKRLEELEKKLAQIKSQDPKDKISELNQKKERIKRIKDVISNLDSALSDEEIENLKKKSGQVKSSREAARIASNKTFSNEPLKGIGAESWKVMFEAARNYSEQEAYPGKEFPVTEGETNCVLCQQKLSPEGADRLKRFDEFVKDKTATIANEREIELKALLQKFEKINVMPEIKTPELLAEVKSMKDGAENIVEAYFQEIKARKESVYKALKDGEWHILKVKKNPIKDLTDIIEGIDKDIAKYQKIGIPEEKAKLEKEFHELDARRELGKKINIINRHIDNLKRVDLLKDCARLTSTRNISAKSSELAKIMISDRLKAEVRKELDRMGLGYLKIDLDKFSRSGVAMHQLRLDTSSHPRVSVSAVLSEGEQKAIAISSFLAELTTSETSTGIVLDDPVSSLDHVIREKVAERLAGEAKNRQVVVFTHDLSFLVALEAYAEKDGVDCKMQTIWANPEKGPGNCDPDAPWDGKKVASRIAYLRDYIVKIKSAMKTGNKEEVEQRTERFYDYLRKTWERIIEEKVFNDVVKRFRYGIQTQSLREVMVGDEDYMKIEQGISRASNAVHDQAEGRGYALPPADEMERDLKEIDEYHNLLKQRNRQTGERRKNKGS